MEEDSRRYTVPGHFEPEIEQVMLSFHIMIPINLTIIVDPRRDPRRDFRSLRRRTWGWPNYTQAPISTERVIDCLGMKPGLCMDMMMDIPDHPMSPLVELPIQCIGVHIRKLLSRVGFNQGDQWGMSFRVPESQSANELYPLNFRPYRNQGSMTEAWTPSQGPADVDNIPGSRGSVLKVFICV